jgi:c-di-GMP-binding flagellar brake protein YcgR
MPEEQEKHRQAFRLDVNEDIVVTLEEVGRSMSATLVDLSEGGCRLRTRLCIPQSQIAFEWKGPSNKLKLWGQMVGARITERKVAEFGVRFEMAQVEKDKLVSELHEIQRRMAFKPTEPTSSTLPDTGVGRAKRKAYRAPVKFPVSFKSKEKMHEVVAMAGDLSIGGVLLITPEPVTEGSEIELDFVMPVEAVDLGGEQREVLEQGPFGQRKVKKLIPVRPFEPVHAKAKVLKRVGAMPEGTAYGTSFVDLSAFMGEEIARFVHAFQLTQLRRAAAAADS